MHQWYLKTLAERDKKFLADLRAAEDKYKIEKERHAKLLEDAFNNARMERDQAALRLQNEKDLHHDNLEEQERRYNEEKDRHRKVYKEAEERYMK